MEGNQSHPSAQDSVLQFDTGASSRVLESVKLIFDAGHQRIACLEAALLAKETENLALSNENNRLSDELSKMKEELLMAEKRGAAEAEQNMNQLGQRIWRSMAIAFGGNSGKNDQWPKMFANGNATEEEELRNVVEVKLKGSDLSSSSGNWEVVDDPNGSFGGQSNEKLPDIKMKAEEKSQNAILTIEKQPRTSTPRPVHNASNEIFSKTNNLKFQDDDDDMISSLETYTNKPARVESTIPPTVPGRLGDGNNAPENHSIQQIIETGYPEGSALHHAILHDPLPSITALVKWKQDEGANIHDFINARNNLSQTPLHMIIMLNDKSKALGIANYLINNGADLYAKDLEKNTFLHSFIASDDLLPYQFRNLIEYLRTKQQMNVFNVNGGKDGSTPLQIALTCFPHNEEILEAILDSKDVDINLVDRYGDSLLNYAVKLQIGKDFLGKLVELGAEWNHRNFQGESLIHVSAQVGNFKAVEFFLKKGEDVNGVDRQGNTPLHSLMEHGKNKVLEVARRLFGNGVNVSSRNAQGLTALEIGMGREDAKKVMSQAMMQLFDAHIK